MSARIWQSCSPVSEFLCYARVECCLLGKQITCLFDLSSSYLVSVIFRLQKNCPGCLVVSRVSILKHFGRCLWFALVSASSSFLPSLFHPTSSWPVGCVSYSGKSRVRGGSNAKLRYVLISPQSVCLPQRPDSD